MAQLAEALVRLEREATREYLPIIGPAKARFLAGLVRDVRPRQAVEVGTMAGYATMVIAAALPTGTVLDSVERNQRLLARAEANLRQQRLLSRVRLHVGDALDLLSGLTGHFDLVFLDGQRSQYAGYLRQLAPRLTDSAVVVANGLQSSSGTGSDYLDALGGYEAWRTELVNFDEEALAVSWRLR